MTHSSGDQRQADEERTDEGMALSAGEAALHRRLLADGAAWRTRIPSSERLDAHVRALPATMAADERAAPALAWRAPPPATHQANMDEATTTRKGTYAMVQSPTRKLSVWAASIAAVLVVGLLGAVFTSLARSHSPGATGPGSGGVGTPTPTPGPMPTPRPGAMYVVSAVTARGVDNKFTPVAPTGYFKPGNTVYVVLQIRNVPTGTQHTVSITWFLNGAALQVPPNALVQKRITQDSNVYFGLTYPQVGAGSAKIYWDLPTDPKDDLYPDAWLAQTVSFTIQTQDEPPPTPTAPGPVYTPGPTPTPPPTPTPTPMR